MNKTFLTALVTSFAVAVKIRQDDVDASAMTSIEPPVEWSADEYFAQYGELIEAQAYQVAEQAWKNLENNPDIAPLMETCEKGQICRDEVDAWMETEIRTLWESVMVQLRQTIESTTLTTITSIEESWQEKVQCELDFPCCEYSMEYMSNVKTNIIGNRDELDVLYKQWANFEEHRLSLADSCPEKAALSCDLNGPCWNGMARMEDDDCSCPAFEMPVCPMTVCLDGVMNDDCSCPVKQAVVEPVEEETSIELPAVVVEENAVEFDCNTFENGVYQFPCMPTYDNPLIRIDQLWREDTNKISHAYDFLFMDGTYSNFRSETQTSTDYDMPIDGITSIEMISQDERLNGVLPVDRGFIFGHPDGDIETHYYAQNTRFITQLGPGDRIVGVREVMYNGNSNGKMTWTQFIISDGVSFRQEPAAIPNNPSNEFSAIGGIQSCSEPAEFKFYYDHAYDESGSWCNSGFQTLKIQGEGNHWATMHRKADGALFGVHVANWNREYNFYMTLDGSLQTEEEDKTAHDEHELLLEGDQEIVGQRGQLSPENESFLFMLWSESEQKFIHRSFF